MVSLLAIPVDVPFITALALWKSPFMLFRGWKRLLEDLIGREGPFLETVCVPFAGLAILLWPLAVAVSVVASFFSSFALALYSGVVVHQVCLLSSVCFLLFNRLSYEPHYLILTEVTRVFLGRLISHGTCVHPSSRFHI